VTDEQDRERESQASDRTKYEELTEEVAEEGQKTAARLARDPLTEPDEGSD
jgi:hypothetical protein